MASQRERGEMSQFCSIPSVASSVLLFLGLTQILNHCNKLLKFPPQRLVIPKLCWYLSTLSETGLWDKTHDGDGTKCLLGSSKAGLSTGSCVVGGC